MTSPFTANVPQVYADVDREKVLRQGVALGDVYQTMQAFLGGLYVNQFNRFGRQWRVFLQAEGEDRATPEQIGQFYVRNDAGDDGAAVGGAVDARRRSGRSSRTASTSIARRRSPARRRPATARGRRWRRSRRWRAQTLPPRDQLRLVGPVVPGAAGVGHDADDRSGCRWSSCS